MPLASHKWSWLCVGVILIAGFGVAIGTAAEHRDTPNFADTIIRICAAPFRGAAAEETPFFGENSAAMSRMMIGMAMRRLAPDQRRYLIIVRASPSEVNEPVQVQVD